MTHLHATLSTPYRADATLTLADGTRHNLWFEASVPLGDIDATPWLDAALPVAMVEDSDLTISGGSIDAKAARGADQAKRMLHGWYPHLADVALEAEYADAPVALSRGVGCFFSGGVDSFFSAIGHADRVTHLIFVLGYDIDLDQEELAESALAHARKGAAALGKELIEVRTNMRDASRYTLRWGDEYFGAALAAVGHLLSATVSEVLLPSSFTEDELAPWGSHPDLDPLWSSSALSIVHDGVEHSRAEKVAMVAEHDVAMQNLRVCWRNPDESFNCGRCEKCLRTMISLRAAGALERCETLPHSLDLAAVRRMRGWPEFAEENLAVLKKMEIRDRRLERAVRTSIAVPRARRAVGRLIPQSVKDRLRGR